MACQEAWDARDRSRLAVLVGPDLQVEWKRRLDDFDRKGWHNRVSVLGTPKIEYVGLVNREDSGNKEVGLARVGLPDVAHVFLPAKFR